MTSRRVEKAVVRMVELIAPRLRMVDITQCHCVQIPESLLAKSYADVVAYLTKSARNDLDKIRAIFRWTASLDLAVLQSRTTELPEPGTPLDYLLKINWRMGNHANFIVHMARYASYAAGIVTTCIERSEISIKLVFRSRCYSPLFSAPLHMFFI